MITSLDCDNATNNGTLIVGESATGVDSEIAYTDGNGQSHSGQEVASTGVTGLTATLSAGNFATGAGSLTYTITGTPASDGTASFAINIGGQTCSLERGIGPCAGVTAPAGYGLVESSGKCWLDRNLGATEVATQSRDQFTDHASYVASQSASFGDLYQWGRAADGHESRTSGTISTNATTAVPNDGNSWDGKFILESVSPWNWLDSEDDSLWQGVDGTNNPCPAGFRVPTVSEWEDEVDEWVPSNHKGAFNSPLKLPVANIRHRNTGDVQTFYFGQYWSSTPLTDKIYHVKFGETYVQDFDTAVNDRAFGESVRCLKD